MNMVAANTVKSPPCEPRSWGQQCVLDMHQGPAEPPEPHEVQRKMQGGRKRCPSHPAQPLSLSQSWLAQSANLKVSLGHRCELSRTQAAYEQGLWLCAHQTKFLKISSKQKLN